MRRLGRGRAGARGDDYVGGRLDPLAFVVEAGEGVNGADDVSTVNIGNMFGPVDDVAQREAKITVAKGKEVEGVGMAIDGTDLDAIEVAYSAWT